MKRKILIVDDHPIVRDGLTLIINREPDLAVCGDEPDMHAALRKIESLKPDALILDISLSGPDGLDLLKSVRSKDASLRILNLSMHDEMLYAERALRAGANGYIMKDEATEKVIVALRRVLNHEIYVSDKISNRLLQQLVGAVSNHTGHRSVEDLSDRELEVLRLMGEGHSTRQIAQELHLSVKTVESYQAHLKEKLSLKNSRELVQYAIQWALQSNSKSVAANQSYRGFP